MFTRSRVDEASLVVKGDLELLIKRYMFLQEALDKLLGDTNLMMRLLHSENLGNKGKFRDELQAITKPYKNWSYPGKKAKNFRFITEQVRSLLKSLHDRWVISEYCQKHDWHYSTKLIEELHDAGYYPRRVEVTNICRAKSLPTIPEHKTFVMDWSTQDIENVRVHDDHFDIKVDLDWLRVEIPEALRGKHKVSKPSFRLGSDGLFYCTFSYEEKEDKLSAPSGGVGANDWGRINQISCAAVYPDGSWTEQYLGTKEGDHLHDVISVLDDELEPLYRKRDAISALLRGRYDAALYGKWCALEHEIGLLRSKRSRVRDHACRVDARDVVRGFMVEANVDELHLEDLSDMDDSTRLYTVGLSQDYISEACEVRGFACVMVNFSQSSHTNPFTGEHVEPDGNRRVVVDDEGHTLDRDHVASLELCVRPAKREKSGSRREVGRPDISKGSLGVSVRRVRPSRRKGLHKGLVKAGSSSGSRRVRKLLLRVSREALRRERDAFYERVGTRQTSRQVFSGSGRCIAVTGMAWAKSPSGQLPTINNDNQTKIASYATLPQSNTT